MKTNFVEIKDLKVEYVVEGKGQDLLFLHGAVVSFRSRIPFIKSLSRYFRVWAPSIIGFGKSSRIPKRWKFEDYAKFVKAFADEFKIKPIIAGHSLGGSIAIKTKSAFPSSFSSLILFSPAGIKDNAPIKTISLVMYEKLKVLLFRPDMDKKKDVLLNLVYHPFDLLKLIPLYKGLDLSRDIQNIEDKVIIFWGKDDEMLPVKNLKVFAELFQHRATYILEGLHDFLDFNGERIVKTIKENATNVQ